MQPRSPYPRIKSRRIERPSTPGLGPDRLRVRLATPLNEAGVATLSQELAEIINDPAGMNPGALRRDKRGTTIVLDLPSVAPEAVRLDQLCEGLARQGSGLGPARGVEVIEMIGQRIAQAEALGPISASTILIDGDTLRWYAQTQPFLRYLLQAAPPPEEPGAAALARLYVQLLTGDPQGRVELLPDPRPRLVELIHAASAGELSAADFAAEVAIELPAEDRRGPRWSALVDSYLPEDAPRGVEALLQGRCFTTEAVAPPDGGSANPELPARGDNGWSSVLGKQETAVHKAPEAPPTLLDSAQPAPPTLLDQPQATGELPDPLTTLPPTAAKPVEAPAPSEPPSEPEPKKSALPLPSEGEPPERKSALPLPTEAPPLAASAEPVEEGAALAALQAPARAATPPPRFEEGNGTLITWLVGGAGLITAAVFALWTMRPSEPPKPEHKPEVPAKAAPAKAAEHEAKAPKKKAARKAKKPGKALVSLLSEPTGASVEINGTSVGKTPLIQRHPLNPRTSYIIRITKEGYAPWERQLRVSRKTGSLTAKAVLVPEKKRRHKR